MTQIKRMTRDAKSRGRKKKVRLDRAGFTLLELIVASLLFAIGSMAVMTMTFSSMKAYAASRDQTIAADLGQRVASAIKMEAKLGPPILTGGAQSTYAMSSPFGGATGQAIIPVLNAGGPGWTANWLLLNRNDRPLDERLSTLGATRYCIYIRGGVMPPPQTGTGANMAVVGAALGDEVTLHAQIAVVYPETNGTLNNPVSCSASIPNPALLNPVSIAQDEIQGIALEMQGLRAVYTGVVVTVKPPRQG
jgi:prepilin-type N-terminal cleavage/methylation domain-containing protein